MSSTPCRDPLPGGPGPHCSIEERVWSVVKFGIIKGKKWIGVVNPHWLYKTVAGDKNHPGLPVDTRLMFYPLIITLNPYVLTQSS